MQHYVNNRGLAQVMSIVLVILVSVAAVALVSLLIMKLVHEPRLSPVVDCLSAQQSLPVVVNSACYNNTSRQVESSIVLRQTLERFILRTDSDSFACGEGCGLCQIGAVGEARTYYLPVSEKPLSIQSSLDGCVLQTQTLRTC